MRHLFFDRPITTLDRASCIYRCRYVEGFRPLRRHDNVDIYLHLFLHYKPVLKASNTPHDPTSCYLCTRKCQPLSELPNVQSSIRSYWLRMITDILDSSSLPNPLRRADRIVAAVVASLRHYFLALTWRKRYYSCYPDLSIDLHPAHILVVVLALRTAANDHRSVHLHFRRERL